MIQALFLRGLPVRFSATASVRWEKSCLSKIQDGGFGYGSTIHHPLSFRIDHILYSDRLRLRSVGRVKARGLSDHDALVASFDL